MIGAAVICLATNIFFEARGEPVLGQYAVAQVTMRRARGDYKNVCKEVYRPAQFSWTLTAQGRPEKIDPDAWEKARRIAWVVMLDQMPMDFSKGATHFHATYVAPDWSKKFKKSTQIGRHVFYTQAQQSALTVQRSNT